jgi:surface protein
VFNSAIAFDQDIGSWDVSSVTIMNQSKPHLLSHVNVCKDRVPRRRPTVRVLSRAAWLRSSLALLTSPCDSVRRPFLKSDRASFFLLVWCVLCCLVARVGPVTVFYWAGSFDQDIGRWDVSTVTNMNQSKCLPSLERSFPPCTRDPRRDCVCKGRVPRRQPTAAVLSRAARLWSSLALLTYPCESVQRPF